MAITTSVRGDHLLQIQNTTIQAALQHQVESQDIQTFTRNVLANARVAPLLQNVRHRVLTAEPMQALDDKAAAPAEPREWITTIYDYDHNQTLQVRSGFPNVANAVVTPLGIQPLPTFEEWSEAASIVAADPRFKDLMANKHLVPYRPMPPNSEEQAPTGEVERVVNVGLRPDERSSAPHQIVGVNMSKRAVITFPQNSPATSQAGPTTCGVTAGPCPGTARGVAGQMWISWPAQNPVWKFLAIRPSASSGTRASGLELRYVDYKGKRLLYQAHVPILNVLYDNNACGPYRDWIWEEHCFECDGTDVAPGFRWAHTAPKTLCDADSDNGNFTGVAIFDKGEELMLVTEMEAGWYRYIMEWHFHKDGTVQPVFKFGGTHSSCICNVHVHHCYWRFDFDLNTPGNNLVEEFNDPPIIPGTNWHKKHFEIRRNRDASHHRKWRVTNTQSKEQYEIIPGPNDGTADAYGKGDLWVLRYHGAAEIDDGYNSTGGAGTAADIDKFVNGELVENQDVVVWYAAHFRHDVHEQGEHGCHEVGPTLKPIHW